MAEPVTVIWEVATDDTMRSIVRSGTVEADSRLAHSVHVEVAGLEPGRPYWYRFTALGHQSPIGRTRTTPSPTARPDRMRFAFASCSHYELGYFSAYRHMAAEDPDLVLFLGDYIYEYTLPAAQAFRSVRKHDGPTATDVVGYRNRYALYRTDPDLQALHASAPCLVTWDDHEVENDYANEWSQDMRITPTTSCVDARPRIRPTTSTCRCAREPYRKGPLSASMASIASAIWQHSSSWTGASTGAGSPARCRRRGAAMLPRMPAWSG
jgi:alkaline phosphatase D